MGVKKYVGQGVKLVATFFVLIGFVFSIWFYISVYERINFVLERIEATQYFIVRDIINIQEECGIEYEYEYYEYEDEHEPEYEKENGSEYEKKSERA